VKRHRCPAIVLRRWPYSENSLVVRALTPDVGTISLLAKGVNKLKSGSLGILDTWALVELEFGGPEGAEMQNLYHCRLLDRMSGLSADRERLAASGVLAELAELGSPPGQSAAALFLWLQDNLEQLADGARTHSLLLAALLKGLSELGLQPDLDLPPDAPTQVQMWFSPASGGLVVPRDGRRPDLHARRISPTTLAVLRQLRGEPQKHATAELGEVEQCLTILGEFLHYHLERPPKAWHMLHRRDTRTNRRP
jgi:DNA repair protein RecO